MQTFRCDRWGLVYMADMQSLPESVLQEIREGNFVAKRGDSIFNQVSPDQSQEWLNGTGKYGGGIVGITKTPSAPSRWALSYNLRSHTSLLRPGLCFTRNTVPVIQGIVRMGYVGSRKIMITRMLCFTAF